MKISILGTVGIPSNYGGFETLAENLVCFHQKHSLEGNLAVYCSATSYAARPTNLMSAELRYIGLNANGVSSIAYDIVSLFSAVWHRNDVILLLGVSGAVTLPLIRLLSRARIVTNVDGVEWKREKWKGASRWFLPNSGSEMGRVHVDFPQSRTKPFVVVPNAVDEVVFDPSRVAVPESMKRFEG